MSSPGRPPMLSWVEGFLTDCEGTSSWAGDAITGPAYKPDEVVRAVRWLYDHMTAPVCVSCGGPLPELPCTFHQPDCRPGDDCDCPDVCVDCCTTCSREDPDVTVPIVGLYPGPNGTYYGELQHLPEDWVWWTHTEQTPFEKAYSAKNFERGLVVQCRPPRHTERDAAVAERVEVFRKALMVAHSDDWDMETVSEAAHICARVLVVDETPTDPEPAPQPDPGGFLVRAEACNDLFASDCLVTTVGEMRGRTDLDQWEYADNECGDFGWTTWTVNNWTWAPADLPVVVRRRSQP